MSTEPVLLEGYLDHASVPFDVRTLEWFDPTPQQRRRIEETVGKFIYLPIEVNQHLLPASGGENGTRLLDLQGLLDEEIQLERLGHLHALKRRNVLISIDALVEKIVSGMRDGGVENGAVGPEHLEQIRGPVLYALDEWTFVSSNPPVSGKLPPRVSNQPRE